MPPGQNQRFHPPNRKHPRKMPSRLLRRKWEGRSLNEPVSADISQNYSCYCCRQGRTAHLAGTPDASFLLGASSLLTIGFLIHVVFSLINRQLGFLLGTAVILAIFLSITIARNLPFGLRAGFLLGALFLAGTIILFRNGLSGIAFAILLRFSHCYNKSSWGEIRFPGIGNNSHCTIFITVLFLTGSRPIPENTSPDTARLVK